MRDIATELAKKNDVEYNLIRGEDIKFDFDDIVLHKVYPYTTLCKLLGVKEKTSLNKKIVLNELKRYCIFEEIGVNIKIYSVFKTPRKATPIKLNDFKKQFNLSLEDAYKTGVYAVVLHKCVIVGHCKRKKSFLEEFLSLVNPNHWMKYGSVEDMIKKGGVFIPLEIEGEDFNGDVDSFKSRAKYVVERLQKKDDYIIFNDTPRTLFPSRTKTLKVPLNNYHKIMKLLAENRLI